MLPSSFKPRTSADFIGPARHWAEHLDRLIGRAKQNGDPVVLLFLGQPGIGKSALADYATTLLGAGKFSISKYNGTQIKIETVEDIARSLQLRDLFGDYRVVRVEEVEASSNVAQVRWLSLLDDLTPRSAVICTSNCKLKDLESRFQTRFNVMEVEPPTCDEIHDLLRQRWPEIPPATARQIATFSCGCVRQALKDADNALCAAPLALAA